MPRINQHIEFILVILQTIDYYIIDYMSSLRISLLYMGDKYTIACHETHALTTD